VQCFPIHCMLHNATVGCCAKQQRNSSDRSCNHILCVIIIRHHASLRHTILSCHLRPTTGRQVGGLLHPTPPRSKRFCKSLKACTHCAVQPYPGKQVVSDAAHGAVSACRHRLLTQPLRGSCGSWSSLKPSMPWVCTLNMTYATLPQPQTQTPDTVSESLSETWPSRHCMPSNVLHKYC
jgi:hypothetical protein